MNRRQQALTAAGGLAFGAGLAFSFGPPRLTLLNDALRIDYPPARVAAVGVALAGALVAAAALTRRWPRLLALGVAMGALVGVVERASYRMDARKDALVARRFFVETAVPWRAVRKVEPSEAALTVWTLEERAVQIDTSEFRPEQRAALERAIARHVAAVAPAR